MSKFFFFFMTYIIHFFFYLNKSVGTHLHICDKVFTVLTKLEDFDFILKNQIGETRFGKSNTKTKLLGHTPLNLAWIDINLFIFGLIGSMRLIGMENRLGLAVNGFGETKNGFCINIRYITKYSMTIHTLI